MCANTSDPWDLASLDELVSLARFMEQEAIDGYAALARRMTEMGHYELAAVFDALVAEEQGHLNKVAEWENALEFRPRAVPVKPPEHIFDDEGAGTVAPEMLSAYRVFAMAVRNGERAFAFWSYVSAHARSEIMKDAAERMAHEELAHVATLRRERRRAFHREREQAVAVTNGDLQTLEQRLSKFLEARAQELLGTERHDLMVFTQKADLRALSLQERRFSTNLRPERVTQKAVESALPLCEFLADCYLSFAERAACEGDADRAREFASQVIHCLRTLRAR